MYFYIKRFFDFLISAILIILTIPFLIIIAITLFFINNGTPFFIQLRPGKNSKLFNIYKFKTMNDKTDDRGNLLPDHIRLTKFGLLIRKTSIDELLQLFNVIKGDMSLIGPRPLLVEYLHLYNKDQVKRQDVRPGITGWAQVNGRNAISWKLKFEYDVWYVDHISISLDIKILFLTFQKVLLGNDINQVGHATAEKFIGNKQ